VRVEFMGIHINKEEEREREIKLAVKKRRR
jgi:hypothetical protein